MKIIKLLSTGVLLFSIILLGSCKKDGGINGSGEVKGYAVLNGKTLKPTTFYIKYGATTSPGTNISKYDSNSLSDSDGKFNFKGLQGGDYFIYAIGTDNGVSVSGGTHVVLSNGEVKENVAIQVAP
jgi:hypothetical protein